MDFDIDVVSFVTWLTSIFDARRGETLWIRGRCWGWDVETGRWGRGGMRVETSGSL